MKKFSLKLKIYLISLFVALGVLSVIGYNLILSQRVKIPEESIEEKEGRFKLGEVNIDTKNRKIHFKGRVQKDKGWVQFLIYLEGYKWLKRESAIISDAKLSDLQKAIALLNWKLWDEIYYKKRENKKVDHRRFSVSLKWGEKEIEGQELVMAKDKLEIGDFIFLGSPYFDHIALNGSSCVDCRFCPIFHLEEKALRETFIRESGESGYELNQEKMPTQGTEVGIILKLK